MANILDNPTHAARIGYNGFDMSQLVKFSSSVGQLLPVYYDLLQPGDKVRCSTQLKSRTQPLDGPAMMSVKEHIEWYFVPIQQLFKPFEQMFYGIQDYPSDFYGGNPSNLFPHIAVSSVIQAVSLTQGYDEFGISNYANTLRLCDCLGYPVRQFIQGDDDGDALGNNITTFPLMALAYQKIYSDYYRLTDREANDPNNYNVDSLYTTGIIPNNRVNQIFKLRYRAWKRDFFTNNFVSPLFGYRDVGSNGVDLGNVNQWLTSLGLVYSGSAFSIVSDSEGALESDGLKPTATFLPPFGDASDNIGNFSPANIRTMFAVEKLLEITRRAGKHYDKQTLAHFGVDVPTGTSGECFFLGGSTTPIIVGDVISTAATGDAPLGELAGKGYAQDASGDITFEAKTHGVLMAIFSVVPEVDYKNLMLDKLNCLVRPSDFFKPEFDNLGMQPLFQYQSKVVDGDSNGNVIGWQYRYSELKNKYNRVFGSLIASNKNWSTAKEGITGTDFSEYIINPKFLNSVMTYDFDNPWWYISPSTNERVNVQSPSELDSYREYPIKQEEAYSMLYDSDPLLHEIYFKVFKSSKMSTYGLFNL